MNEQTYFGLYCEQCGTWYKLADGLLLFYPALEIANAMLNDRMLDFYAPHRWKVQEFGKEERRNPQYLNAEFRCPLAAVKT